MTNLEEAEVIALQAVAWLVGNEELVSVFLGSTGLLETDLRTRVDDPEMLASVLDFILMDDRWVVNFCDAQKIGYDRIAPARAHLPGGQQVNWT